MIAAYSNDLFALLGFPPPAPGPACGRAVDGSR